MYEISATILQYEGACVRATTVHLLIIIIVNFLHNTVYLTVQGCKDCGFRRHVHTSTRWAEASKMVLLASVLSFMVWSGKASARTLMAGSRNLGSSNAKMDQVDGLFRAKKDLAASINSISEPAGDFWVSKLTVSEQCTLSAHIRRLVSIHCCTLHQHAVSR